MKTLTSSIVIPLMFELKYNGSEDFIYVFSERYTTVDTYTLFDIKGSINFSFMLSNDLFASGLSVAGVAAEEGKSVQVIFENESKKDFRIKRGMVLGFVVLSVCK